MRIALLAPLYESVPPKLYGGTERVVSYLAEELVNLGHRVTLFASGDSVTRAELVPVVPKALRLAGSKAPLAHHVLMLGKLKERARDFDVIHHNADYLHFPTSRALGQSNVTTLHGRLDLPELQPLFTHFNELPLISISDAQRIPIPAANWQATVHHGLPRNLYSPAKTAAPYLAFVGRISREKGVDRAIEIAGKAQLTLKIAAKVDDADREYFESEVKPLLSHTHVDFVGEVDDAQKGELLRGARALLFPIDWPEPFGLVMIEAMACGTPVVAWPGGAVREIIAPGDNGYVVTSIDDAVAAVQGLAPSLRRRCREIFEERFTASRMARQYLQVYERLLG